MWSGQILVFPPPVQEAGWDLRVTMQSLAGLLVDLLGLSASGTGLPGDGL
jgi:hypothetical protein